MSSGINQVANAVSTQEQNANQSNSNIQLTAVAIAEGGGNALAEQNSYQENTNSQNANTTAKNTNVGCSCASDVSQTTEADTNQIQTTNQRQTNHQEAVVAIALNEGSQAIAKQSNEQSSVNQQIGESSTENRNNTLLSSSTSVEPENREEVKPGQNMKISKDIKMAADKVQKPFKVELTMKKNGNTLKMKADETGDVTLDGIEEASQYFKKTEGKAQTEGKNQLNEATNVNDLKIKIDYDNQILEIHSDEQGRIFINGIEVEI